MENFKNQSIYGDLQPNINPHHPGSAEISSRPSSIEVFEPPHRNIHRQCVIKQQRLAAEVR